MFRSCAKWSTSLPVPVPDLKCTAERRVAESKATVNEIEPLVPPGSKCKMS